MDDVVASIYHIVGDPETLVLRWGGQFYPFGPSTLCSPKEAAVAVALLRDGAPFEAHPTQPEALAGRAFTVTEADMREIGYGTH